FAFVGREAWLSLRRHGSGPAGQSAHTRRRRDAGVRRAQTRSGLHARPRFPPRQLFRSARRRRLRGRYHWGLPNDGPYILPATPPPAIDLTLWDKSFAEITARKPKRLFLTPYGFANDPAAHVAVFRERLHRWTDEAEKILRQSARAAGVP